jgi:hypothetical protein
VVTVASAASTPVLRALIASSGVESSASRPQATIALARTSIKQGRVLRSMGISGDKNGTDHSIMLCELAALPYTMSPPMQRHQVFRVFDFKNSKGAL